MKANAPLKILTLFSKTLPDTNMPNVWKSCNKRRPDGKRGRAGDQNSLINLLNGHTGSCRAETRPWLCHSGLSDESGACISELSERANTLSWQKKNPRAGRRAHAHTRGPREDRWIYTAGVFWAIWEPSSGTSNIKCPTMERGGEHFSAHYIRT